MLEANDMVEAKLAEIRERKIYEMKRMFAAKMHEGVGGLTKAEVEARKKAGYRKASEVLGDPRKEMTPIAGHQFKKVKKKVVEAVEVQPDPEGRVRGGKAKPAKENPLMRKITAKIIKVGRKVGGKEFRKSYLAGKEAGDTATTSMKAKAAYDEYKKKKAEPSVDDHRKDAGTAPSNDTAVAKKKFKDGRIAKAATAAVGSGIARGIGRSVGSVVSDLESIGTKHL